MPKSNKNNLTKLQAKWLKIINACESSGKSIKAYADAKGLVAQDLYAWKKVLVSKGLIPRSHVRFDKAAIVEPLSTPFECRVLLPNGVTVMMSGLAEDQLGHLLHNAMQLK